MVDSGNGAERTDTGQDLAHRRRLLEEYENAVRERDQATRRTLEAHKHASEITGEADLMEGVFGVEMELSPEQKRRREKVKEAERKERTAEEKVEAALGEFLQATIEPRVEGSKLRFEVHKLRATLGGASIVGIAAVSGIVLPPERDYLWILLSAFLCLLLSVVLSLGSMERIGTYVENTMVVGQKPETLDIRSWVARWSFPLGIAAFLVFVTLNFF